MDTLNKSIWVGVLEDEAPAARILMDSLKNLRPQWKIEHIGGTIEEAETFFKDKEVHPDLLFLDVELSDGNSFQFLEEVHPDSVIIFVTAYDEFALRAFSVNSIDYLLKPIDELRLAESLDKFERLSQGYRQFLKKQTNWEEILNNLNRKEKKYRTRFLLDRGNQMDTVQVEDIAYFFSENKISYAQTFNQGVMVIDFSLEKLGEELDPDKFFRTSRQTLISTKAIEKIENDFLGKISVTLKPAYKEKVRISREKTESFRRWLNF